jgi:hypothetical protein
MGWGCCGCCWWCCCWLRQTGSYHLLLDLDLDLGRFFFLVLDLLSSRVWGAMRAVGVVASAREVIGGSPSSLTAVQINHRQCINLDRLILSSC